MAFELDLQIIHWNDPYWSGLVAYNYPERQLSHKTIVCSAIYQESEFLEDT